VSGRVLPSQTTVILPPLLPLFVLDCCVAAHTHRVLSRHFATRHAVLRFVARSVNHGASMTPALSSKVSSAHRNMYIQLDLHWTLGSYNMVCTGHCHCGLNAGLQRTPALYT
jgi:hypothetical protein